MEKSVKHITEMMKREKNSQGVSLFEHLSTVFYKIINSPNKLTTDIQLFEMLSDFVKKNSFRYRDPESDENVNNIPIKIAEHDEWINKCLDLLKEAKSTQLQSIPIYFQDFMQDSRMFQWTGYSFGEEENYRIAISLQKLAQDTNAKEMRFWGQILCRDRDYYVAEGVTSNLFSDILPKGCEQQGQGVNAFTYWVTHSVLDEWTQLPLVTPQQVKIARQFKYIFTGDLQRPVKSYPHFPGKEQNLLRAQIARISSATVLVPKGIYKLNQEVATEIVLEEIEGMYKMPEYGELKSLDTWQHWHPPLLGLGRTTHWVDPTNKNAEQIDAENAELVEKDPQIDRLKPISDEKLPYVLPGGNNQGEEPMNWTVKELGDPLIYNKEDVANNYGVITLQNMTWPGAICVASTQGWANIYVGYGLQFNQLPFFPISPDEIKDEGQDNDEFPEPNPSQAPYTLEPDSDDEGQQNQEEENA